MKRNIGICRGALLPKVAELNNDIHAKTMTLPLPLLEVLLTLRSVLFLGTKYTCPCCGWHVRAFTDDNAIFRERSLSYCPRCNSKARHRRIWLFLEEKTNLFSERLSLFEVSPKYSFSRRFNAMPNLTYFGADLVCRPHISARLDLTAMPVRTNTFDAVICVHVLEEIADDRKAMTELFRVLKPGGWAVISVPTRMDRLTYEDPALTTPEERQRAFGEAAHVRIYGYDLVDRLEQCGFRVQVDLAENVPVQTREKYGLRNDENIFYCTKPAGANMGTGGKP